MLQKLFYLALSLALVGCASPSSQGDGSGDDDTVIEFKKYASDDEVKVMSFNVLVAKNDAENENDWIYRKKACVELIEDHQPDLLGLQEAKYTTQFMYLKNQFSASYDAFGVNRNTGEESADAETTGILYNKSRLELVDWGTFWLSETPNVPSKGWDANYFRNATWGIFKHKPTNRDIYYINTHLDHQSTTARENGMKIIADSLKAYGDKGYMLFLTGDLNTDSSNVALDAIRSFMWNTRYYAPSALTDFNRTYNGFSTTKKSIIDHIYCDKGAKVVEYHTIDEPYEGVEYVSDHYPIYSIIKVVSE